MDEYGLDSLLRIRKSDEALSGLIGGDYGDSRSAEFMQLNDKECDDDAYFIGEFEKGLKSVDASEFPMGIFEDKLTWSMSTSPIVLPRLKRWLFEVLSQLPPRKVMASQTVLLTLLQEALLVPEEAKSLGDIIHRYGCRLPDFSLHLDIYLNLFYEAVISSKCVLPFFVSFLRPKIFQQEMSNSYYNHSDIVLVIMSCLMCREVQESPHICFIIRALERYLSEPLDDCLERILAILEQIMNYDQPKTISRMISSIPLNGANSILIVKCICFTVISKYLNTSEIENVDDLIKSLPELKVLCDSTIELETLKAEVVITLIEKLCLVLIKTKDVTCEQLVDVSKGLRFQISHSFGTYVELKEHLFLVSKQIEFFSLFIKSM